jgi:hypothetical protein
MKSKRLAFAKKYKHWTEKEWSKVMFSDESTFRCRQIARAPADWIGSFRFSLHGENR